MVRLLEQTGRRSSTPWTDGRTDGRHHDLWGGHQADGSMCTVETASSQAQLWGEAWIILWDRPSHCRKLLSEPLRAALTSTTNEGVCKHLFLMVPEAGRPRSRQTQSLVRTHFPVHRRASSLYSPRWRKGQGSYLTYRYKDMNSTCEAHLLTHHIGG